jgi:hypothetical protein
MRLAEAARIGPTNPAARDSNPSRSAGKSPAGKCRQPMRCDVLAKQTAGKSVFAGCAGHAVPDRSRGAEEMFSD